MTKMVWGEPGTRRYEAGVDHGVLYLDGQAYPWSGLVSVKEEHTGGTHRAYYVDGVRYANRITLEEFGATVEAYTYPPAFEACDGTKMLSNGLFATKQRRKSFNFSYRTRVGNDIEGLDHGYKIHIVYNATALPFDRSNSTLSESLNLGLFSWKVVTKPPVLDFVPTAHMIIDSRSTPDGLLRQVEDILYGNSIQEPRLPEIGELAFLFSEYTNPDQYDAGDPDDAVYFAFDAGGPDTPVSEIIDGGVV